MKKEKVEFSWFQKIILGFVGFMSFIIGARQGELQFNPGGFLGEVAGRVFGLLLLMWLYNKFVAKRIIIHNKYLKKLWLIVKIIIYCLMVSLLILFVYGLSRSAQA